MAKKKKSQPLPPAPDGTVDDDSWGGSSTPAGSPTRGSGSSPGGAKTSSPPSSSSSKGAGKPSTANSSVPTVVDMTKAREEALFQLRLGRQALVFGFLVGLLLIVDSAISLLLGTGALSPTTNGSIVTSWITNDAPLALPLAAALFLSLAVTIEKWDTYAYWPFEDHFVLTVAGLSLSAALVAIYAYHFTTPKFDLLKDLGSYVYPLGLVALSLAAVSLGATWRGWPIRKVSSIILAALPPVLYFPLRQLLDPLNNGPAELNLALSITFGFAAFLYTSSGAQLHLMASATRAQEREVVAGSHEKLFHLSQELTRRSEAAAFREGALSRREVDVEAQEAALAERSRFLEDRRAELERLDAHLRKRSDEIALSEQAMLPKLADVRASEATMQQRGAALASREDELQTSFQRLGERERTLLARDQSLRQKELELQNRAAEVGRAEAQSRVVDTTAQQRLQEAERRFQAAVAKEAEVRSMQATMSVPAASRAPALAKESDLSRREAELEARRAELTDRDAASSQKEQALERRRVELQQVAATILEREKALAAREATISAKGGQYDQELELLKAATRRHEEETRKYYESTKQVALVESQGALKIKDLSAREQEINLREQKAAESAKSIQARREELERQAQQVAARQRALEAQAADLTVRSSRLEEAAARLAPSKSEKEEQFAQALRDRERALEFRERQLSEREQKLRAQTYERDRQGTPRVDEPTDLLAPGGAAGPAHRPGRASTGTPRLDDLLLGGFPEKGHVAFVGPAFVGKEVAIYSFLAEGLRHGQAALIVATGRQPAEYARDLGTLVPSLVEYEQGGRVIWIDASNPSGLPGTDARASRGSTVKGPGDLVGILQAVSRHATEFDRTKTPFRLAFLSLSACMTQTDEKGAAAFVQNLLGILRPKVSLGGYSVDRGMHSVQQVESIVSQMDGAIEFRSERGKTQLQIIGLGEVQSRQWVDYRFTQRALQLGSFSLERIR